MTDQIRNDPRTAWAASVYERVPWNPPISCDHSAAILAWLGEAEHAEIILRARWGRGLARPGFNDEPTGIAVRTLARGLYLGPDSADPVEWLPTGIRASNRGGDRAAPEEWSIAFLTQGAEGPQLFTPTEQVGDVLLHGAGEHILRLPHQPGVPSMPAVARSIEPKPVRDEGRLLAGWTSLEELATEHLRNLGFGNVRRTGPGRDAGIDVIGDTVAAQAKMTALPVGRPVLQQLHGAATSVKHVICYTTAGYSAPAVHYANQQNVALFQVSEDGVVNSINAPAEALVHTAANSPDAPQWQSAYGYIDEVRARLRPVLARTLPGAKTTDDPFVARCETYRRGAQNIIRGGHSFTDPRAAIVAHHHAELLGAVWDRHVNATSRGSASEAPGLSLTDFY